MISEKIFLIFFRAAPPARHIFSGIPIPSKVRAFVSTVRVARVMRSLMRRNSSLSACMILQSI